MNLVRQPKELSTTDAPSSQDLVLGKMLDLAAQMMGREVAPGEIRLWSETFRTTNPSTLESAFRDYLKTAKFFPKPGDIYERIENIRSNMITENQRKDRSEIEREQESPEWQAVSLKARTTLAQIADGAFNPKRNTRETLKQQAAELLKKRGTVPTAAQPEELPEAITESTQRRQG